MSAAAFLQHIREHPDDDTVRLIYADWLEEHAASAADRDRALFIRMQCRLAAGVADIDERLTLLRESRALLRQHRTTWLGPLHGLVADAVFRRGFVERVEIEAESFVDHGDELFAVEPVRDVCFHHLQAGHLPLMAAAPYLRFVRRLELQPRRHDPASGSRVRDLRLPAVGLAALFSSPHLERLTELDLYCNHLSRAGAIALATAPGLARLERLDLSNCALLDDGLLALVESPYLECLSTLILDTNRFGPRGLRGLTDSSRLQRLTNLDLSDNDISETELMTLASSALMGRLRELTICRKYSQDEPAFEENGVRGLATSGPANLRVLRLLGLNLTSRLEAILHSLNTIGLRVLDIGGNPEFGAMLARVPFLANLQELRLARMGLSLATLRGLTRQPEPLALERLDLGFNGLGAEEIRELVGSGVLGRLRELKLTVNNLGPEGAAVLARASWQELRSLDLGDNGIGVAGVQALAVSPLGAGLTYLQLQRNNLDDKGAEVLANAPILRRLTTLNLKANRLGDRAAIALAGSPHLDNLIELDVRANRFGLHGPRLLKDRFGADAVLL